MTKAYNNDDINSPIAAIVFPASGSGRLVDVIPRVQLRDDFKSENSHGISFELIGTDEKGIKEYVIKCKDHYLCTASTIVTTLHEAKLIDGAFKDKVISTEINLYHEEKKNIQKRRIYEYPQDENSLIEAFMVQLHGSRFAAFVKFKEGKTEKLRGAKITRGS